MVTEKLRGFWGWKGEEPMKLELENTDRMVEVNGVPARIWEGRTASGIPVAALIVQIAVHRDQDQSPFQAELLETKPPSAMAEAAFPLLRMVF